MIASLMQSHVPLFPYPHDLICLDVNPFLIFDISYPKKGGTDPERKLGVVFFSRIRRGWRIIALIGGEQTEWCHGRVHKKARS